MSSKRLAEIEGLRGIASVMVVLFHFAMFFYPGLMFGVGTLGAPVQHSSIESLFYSTPALALISGPLAVTIFFILSGFVLSIGFFETKKSDIIKNLMKKRYLRLMIPALCSTVIAWTLLSLSLSGVQGAVAITNSGWLKDQWVIQDPSLWGAVIQGSYDIFINGKHDYNAVLWTMQYEFIGSFIVMVTAWLFGGSKKRWLVYTCLAVATFGTWFMGFIIGMVFADIYSRKPNVISITRFHLTLLIALAAVFGAYIYPTVNSSWYNRLSIGVLSPTQNIVTYMVIAGCIIFFITLYVDPVKKFLANRFLSRLGKYTFSLYLTHKLVIFTFTAHLFIYLHRLVGYNWAACIAILGTLPVLAVVAIYFEKYVDSPSIRLSNRFAKDI